MYQSFSGDSQEKRKYLVFGAEKYIENKPLFDDVSCQSCFEIQAKMKQCTNCLKVYCNNCLNTKASKNCPCCQSAEESLLPNQRLMTLNQIFFKCQYHVNGCATCLNVESLPTHEQSCPFIMEKKIAHLSSPYQSSTQFASLNQSTGNVYGNTSSNIVYSTYKNADSQEEYVPMSLFVQLQNEVKLLNQLCASNFKNHCNNGHVLQYEARDATITSNVICDVCKREPTIQAVGSYRCAACDFDRCEQCYQQNRIF